MPGCDCSILAGCYQGNQDYYIHVVYTVITVLFTVNLPSDFLLRLLYVHSCRYSFIPRLVCGLLCKLSLKWQEHVLLLSAAL